MKILNIEHNVIKPRKNVATSDVKPNRTFMITQDDVFIFEEKSNVIYDIVYKNGDS